MIYCFFFWTPLWYSNSLIFLGAAGLTCRKCIEEYKKEERGLFATHLQYGAAGGNFANLLCIN